MADFIVIEQDDIGKIAERMSSSPKRVERATRLAANKVVGRLQTPIRRYIAKDIGVRQKTLKERFVFRRAKRPAAQGDNRETFARLWVGLNPIDAAPKYFKKFEQDETGAWADSYFFHGAFLAYRGNARRFGVYKRKRWTRFPIVLQSVEIDKPSTQAEITRARNKARDDYAEEVKRLLRDDWRKSK